MHSAKGGYLYMVSCKNNQYIYAGVTSSLLLRIHEHKIGLYKGSYSNRRKTHKLVYYQFYETIEEAINMEKYLKGKKRSFKINIIDDFNPEWIDLFQKAEDLGLE